jgi:hypothetical protein
MTGLLVAASLALLAAPSNASDLQQAVTLARSGDVAAARRILDALVRETPQDASAWAERGGLSFREGRYADATSDLERALALAEDPHTRALLAASLALGGHTEAAIVHWNAVGRPLVRHVHIEGLKHTSDAVARREISVEPGEMLKSTDPEESRAQLEQVGVFRSISIRPVPLADGRVDVQVHMAERRGFGRPLELLLMSGANALRKRARLVYHNLEGQGVNLGGQLRWDLRQEKSAFLEWPRPFGLASHLTIEAVDGRQPYELAEPATLRHRGLGLVFRSVLAPRSTVRWGIGFRERSFDRLRPGAFGGSLATAEGGIDTRLVNRPHVRLHGEARLGHSQALSGQASFGELRGGARFSWTPRRWEAREGDLQSFELALLVRAAEAYGTVPLDGMFTPGSASDMEFPLRAHKIRRDGAIGRTPFGPRIFNAVSELRVRLFRHAKGDLGLVPFLDTARIHLPEGGQRTLSDLGLGVRIGVRGSTVVRADWAHGVNDGKDAWTFGLGQSF